jgi:hypothetical protein
MKIKFTYLTILVLFCLALLTTCTNTETETEQRPMALVAPPSGGAGDLFSTRCKNARVRGFTLFARCKDFYGNSLNSGISFANCIKNYDGNLSSFTGAVDELFTRRCFTNGTYLICDCQQPTGGFKQCSIRLDDIFTVNNGQLSC